MPLVRPVTTSGEVAPDLEPGTPPSLEVQLAVYRLAWAALRGCTVETVRAAFHYVRSGQTVAPDTLLGSDDLLALLTDDAA